MAAALCLVCFLTLRLLLPVKDVINNGEGEGEGDGAGSVLLTERSPKASPSQSP